jgi:CheY-like chemotaxis protein
LKKILIADDLEEIRELLEVTFKSAGYQSLFMAKNGKNAIEIARKEKPDLILMDIMMPGKIDGLEATRILKKDPGSKNSIIVMLTAQVQKNDRDRAFVYGADHFISKPFSPKVLVKTVEQWL